MYEVEKIVSSRFNKTSGKNQYLVKWVGYDNSQNTWEPEKNLSTVKNLIQKFNSSNGKAPTKNNTESEQLHILEGISDQQEENEEKKSLGSFGDESQKVEKASDMSSKKQQPKKSKNKKGSTTTATEQPKKGKKEITITGMSIKDGTYIYKALVDGEIRWIKRSFLVPTYLEELCQYYEQNLVLKE